MFSHYIIAAPYYALSGSIYNIYLVLWF